MQSILNVTLLSRSYFSSERFSVWKGLSYIFATRRFFYLIPKLNYYRGNACKMKYKTTLFNWKFYLTIKLWSPKMSLLLLPQYLSPFHFVSGFSSCRIKQFSSVRQHSICHFRTNYVHPFIGGRSFFTPCTSTNAIDPSICHNRSITITPPRTQQFTE